MEYKEINIEKLIKIAFKAGEAVMEVYAKDFEVEIKADNSPLTEADKKSNAVIISELKTFYPDIPVISEETKLTPYIERKEWNRFWLIDPIDGTKEFIKKNGEFTINIALIEHGEPVVGIVYAPALNLMYAGVKGLGTFKLKDDGVTYKRLTNPVHYKHKSKVIVVASRSHLSAETVAFVDAIKAEGKEVEFLSSGSSLKFCLVAEGKADVYPRFGPTMEWDTGAAHAVAKYAGRTVINNETHQPLTYNKENLLNPWFIVE
jgi:3'(2'), 5'-bisphosphate nucleotidase